MSNDADFCFIYFFSMGIRLLFCQRTYFRLFFLLLPKGEVQGDGDFIFIIIMHQEKAGLFCGKRQKGKTKKKGGEISFIHLIDLPTVVN